jgi:MinD-like ATPase involved in chromosome partitioning or flagellar assembly
VSAAFAPRAEPAIAIVFSPEPWVEALHAYLADHGGARVRQMVLDPQVAWEEEYDTLVVSHRWPSLTLALVEKVHALGRSVLGVFDADEPGGRDRLEALGVDGVVAAASSPPEFVDALQALGTSPGTRRAPVRSHGAVAPPDAVAPRHGIVAVGGVAGAGITEVAVGLAAAVAARGEPVVLADCDDAASSVAGRLALPIEPNLRTAVDAGVHGLGALRGTLARTSSARLQVLCGFPSAAAAVPVTPHEVVDVVQALRAQTGCVVVDVGGRADSPVARAVAAGAAAVVGVGSGNPVGVARLLAWVAEWRPLLAGTELHLVVNRAPADRYRRHEIASEIARTFEPASLVFAPHDRRVDAAAWDGELVSTGPFTNALAAVLGLAHPRTTRRRREARRPARRRGSRSTAVAAS